MTESNDNRALDWFTPCFTSASGGSMFTTSAEPGYLTGPQ